ncbi:MAG: hypothetical protein HZB92_05995 [Euryarchaeota archaeon]|nr:hypothetical protein [Euryarchaeota archaeon]
MPKLGDFRIGDLNGTKLLAVAIAGIIVPLFALVIYRLVSAPLLGLVGFLIITLLFALWNGRVFFEQALSVNRANRFSAVAFFLTLALFIVFACWTFLHPVIFRYDRAILLATYVIALLLSIAALIRVKPRGLRNFVAPVYNIMGVLVLLAIVISDAGMAAAGPLASLASASVYAQQLMFPLSLFAAPFFLLPPFLVRIEPEGAPPLSGRGKISLMTVAWAGGKALGPVCAYFIGLTLMCLILIL